MRNQEVFLKKKKDIKFEKYSNFESDKASIALVVTDKQNTPMEAGIFKFNTSFDYILEADEVIFVLKGCLIITHKEKKHNVCEGDYIFLRKGAKANWSCNEEVEYFYATYPIYDIK